MPKTITLLADRKATTILYELLDGDRRLTSLRMNPSKAKDQKEIAAAGGVDVPTVLGWIDKAQAAPGNVQRFPVAEAEGRSLDIWIRKLDQRRVSADTQDHWAHRRIDETPDGVAGFLSAILPKAAVDDLIDWDDRDALCCLDVDYHDTVAPAAEWVLTTAAARLVPAPAAYHLSRNGGLHAFYLPVPGVLTAREVAALAAIRWKELDPTAGVELKTQVRGPGQAQVFHPAAARTTEGIRSAALGWLGNDAVGAKDRSAEWLEANGMSAGGRYDHDRCPIAPSATGKNCPVTVGDDGVFCHVCSGHGVQYKGCTTAGFAPWTLLCGDDTRPASLLGLMVRHQTHWGHAKLVIRATTGLSGSLAETAYRAALKVYHADTPDAGLTPLAFHPDTAHVARLLPNRWATIGESYTFPATIAPLLATLPACNYVSEEGKVCVRASTVNLFQQPTLDLSDRGYPAVEIIRGVRMHSQYRDRTRLVDPAPAPWMRGVPTSLAARYVDPSKRVPVAEARALIESALPGVDWRYIDLILAGRACNEARIGLPQHILVTGVSGAGKSSHVLLAAGIAGDVATPVLFQNDVDRFRSSVREASASGGIILFDEFMKDTLRANRWMSPEQTLEPLLNFTPDSLSHKLHLGPVALGNVGVCVWTETWIPEALRAHTQIARRVHYLDLRSKVDWETGLAALGLSKPHELRTVGQPYADAMNAVLSDLIDRECQHPAPFTAVAQRLGVRSLHESPEFNDPTQKYIAFFDLVAAEPELDGPNKRRFAGDGYKVIGRGGSGDLFDLWNDLCDGQEDRQWCKSTKISGEDWGKLLGVPHPIHFDATGDNKRVAVRFRVGPAKDPLATNAAIRGLK